MLNLFTMEISSNFSKMTDFELHVRPDVQCFTWKAKKVFKKQNVYKIACLNDSIAKGNLLLVLGFKNGLQLKNNVCPLFFIKITWLLSS